MDLPKCRTCGERHRLGGCPSSLQRSKPNQFEDAARGRDAAPKTSRGGVESGPPQTTAKRQERVAGNAAVCDDSTPGFANRPARAKPAKKAKPKGKTKKKPKKARRQAVKAPAFDAGIAGSNPAASATIKRHPGRPRESEKHLTLAATEPWIAMGKSRATYFRQLAKAKEKAK